MNGLTGFQRDILYILAGLDEPNGSEIRTHLEEYYGTTVDRGQLYPNLDRLVKRELVKKKQEDKQQNAYTLTPEGQREINSRRQWENKQYFN